MEREPGSGKWVSMHRAQLCVSGSGIKHQGKFQKAQGALESIREPHGRVSEVVGGLHNTLKCRGQSDSVFAPCSPVSMYHG